MNGAVISPCNHRGRCAEMVRTALKLGFKVVAYEALSDATGDARETEQARNLYNEVSKKDPAARLVLFVTSAGKPWALRAGYDVNVFFPSEQFHQGRPTWLTLGGQRRPYAVTGEICEHQFPCLVEARYAGESDDAISADRLVLEAAVQNITPDSRITVNHNNADAGIFGADELDRHATMRR